MNIPNILSSIRIALVPAFVYFWYAQNFPAALYIFIIASVTDFFDGYLARRLNAITDLGKLLDPLADKLLTGASFICLYFSGYLHLVALIVIILREIAITYLRKHAAKKGYIIAANNAGKIKTVLQMSFIIIALASLAFPTFTYFARFTMLTFIFKIIFDMVALVTLYSASSYLKPLFKRSPCA